MQHDLNLNQLKKLWHGTTQAYLIGFILSLLLTLASFSLVHFGVISGYALVGALSALAIIQAIVQLLFFLHIGQEGPPKWDKLIFYFMVLVLLIIVLGSLWIMYDLDTRVMAGMEHMHD